MKQHLLNTRFTYRADYVLRKARKSRCVFLTDEIPVVIREVDAVDAPVAYRINSHPHGFGTEVQVRSFDGSLWWPLADGRGPFKSSDLLALVKRYWDGASAAFDPMRRTYNLPGPSADEFFASLPIRQDKFVSTRKEQSESAERDASRIIFCEGYVLVDAGEPVWYAVHHAPTRMFDLFIGHSNLDRANTDGYSTPGPDRGSRMTCARLGRAFGLDEFDVCVRSLGGEGNIRRHNEIVSMSERVSASAADVCVRALAQYLWEIAWRYPDLRKAMPSVANASHPKPPPEMLPHRQMLQELVGFEDPRLTRGLSALISDAQRILERIAMSEAPPLTDEEQDAVALLAV